MIELKKPFGEEFEISDDYEAHLARNSSAPGVDWKLPWGTKVLAAAAGKVVRSAWNDLSGRYVVVDHGGGWKTGYRHLALVKKLKGELVIAGEPIGVSGSTGRSTGPHLHFDVRRDGQWKDPETLIVAE